MIPLFKHDCPDCIFLGQDKGVDLYWCTTDKVLVVRYRGADSIGKEPACSCCAPEDVAETYENDPLHSMNVAYKRWYQKFREV